MHDLEILQSGGYNDAALTKLKLACPLQTFPTEIFNLGPSLEQLDLSGTGLSSLPTEFGRNLPNLKIAFFSQCAFSTFPSALASCSRLEMVAFRGNGMASIPEDSLPPQLRWLILTDNKLSSLPRSIGRCERLQKCMLAGNRLQTLPDELQHCKKLGLLRLSSNNLRALPDWLFSMPELAFLSFAGNPCSASEDVALSDDSQLGLAHVNWSELEVQHTLGEGASGIISKGLWRIDPSTTEEVAIKLFRGALTSDGTPQDEMAACIAAGQHQNIIDVLGRIHGHPEEASGAFKGGLVMQLIPPYYQTLGQPPSLLTCTRDTYPLGATMSLENALSILQDIAAAAAHLHYKKISHGDLYAHNILTSDDGHALLGDFGAATVHGGKVPPLVEMLEVLAFAHLVEDLLGLVTVATDEQRAVVGRLEDMHRRCSTEAVPARPSFKQVFAEITRIHGGKASSRLPN
ncbi:leucine-rich repeat-containing protein 28 [Diaporthe helianthi]|uniref:Leucine-rich repeat-containing protein 28 n=1 Tax=Diaporthe helianthi TaxID=158607 RepID=A0A2P5ICY4_DIAHE|nr:leucine-rich repeat-containing protein 28 [Diaporthe helianthi]